MSVQLQEKIATATSASPAPSAKAAGQKARMSRLRWLRIDCLHRSRASDAGGAAAVGAGSATTAFSPVGASRTTTAAGAALGAGDMDGGRATAGKDDNGALLRHRALQARIAAQALTMARPSTDGRESSGRWRRLLPSEPSNCSSAPGRLSPSSPAWEKTGAAESSDSYSTYGHAMGESPGVRANDADGLYRLGYWSNPGSAGTYQVYVGLNKSTVGPPTTIEAADFIASQDAELGDFYDGGGTVKLDKLAYQTRDDTILDAAVTSSIGTLATSSSVATPSITILTPHRADVTASTQRQPCRPSGPNGATNTHPQFTCAGSSFKTTYLMP
jgi:hypothetical protein